MAMRRLNVTALLRPLGLPGHGRAYHSGTAATVVSVAARRSAPRCWLWGLAPSFARFALVGVSGAVVNTLALFTLHGLLRMPLAVSGALAVETAIMSNYVWNERWTFRCGLSPVRFAKFNITSLGGMALSVGVLALLAHGLGVHYLAANAVGIGVAAMWNFGASVLWTWRRTRAQAAGGLLSSAPSFLATWRQGA